jgi:hypothetical protein
MDAGALKDTAATVRKNEGKWTKTLMDAGWNAFPSILIEKQQALGLDALDMNIILHLSNYWWNAETLPFPSVATIAQAVGVKPRTVQKRVSALQRCGLLDAESRLCCAPHALPRMEPERMGGRVTHDVIVSSALALDCAYSRLEGGNVRLDLAKAGVNLDVWMKITRRLLEPFKVRCHHTLHENMIV